MVRVVTKPNKAGRARAERLYPGQPCEVCGMVYGGRGRVQRHHRDSDRMNNAAENIAFLCVQHHKDAHRASDGALGGGVRPRVNALLRDRAAQDAEQARSLMARGVSIAEIATMRAVSPWTVYRWLRKYPAS